MHYMLPHGHARTCTRGRTRLFIDMHGVRACTHALNDLVSWHADRTLRHDNSKGNAPRIDLISRTQHRNRGQCLCVILDYYMARLKTANAIFCCRALTWTPYNAVITGGITCINDLVCEGRYGASGIGREKPVGKT